jgi:hypothetical protein
MATIPRLLKPVMWPPAMPGVYRRDLAPGHQFRFFHRLFDGVHRGFDVDHHTLAQTDGWMGSDPDDIDLLARHLADHRAYFGGSDIQADDDRAFSGSLQLTPPHGPNRPDRPMTA